MPSALQDPEVSGGNAVGQRFRQERERLGFKTGSELAKALDIMPSTVSKSESGWTLPSAGLLARFAEKGCDVQYILTGVHSRPILQLEILFGRSLPHQEPLHLLGASMCLLNGCAEYTADLNPYPPKSPHHAGVETGWRMARAVITGDTTELPGVL
jgi:transcriptional regulator with XRE-family HTH domain